MNQRFNIDNRTTILLSQISLLCQNGSLNTTVSFRERQLFAANQLTQQILGADKFLVRDQLGRPSVNNAQTHVSLSHTGDFISIIENPHNRVAIDIEPAARNVDRLASKFTSETELSEAQAVFPSNPVMLIWTCKECLFKVLRTEGVLFREQLTLRNTELREKEVRISWNVNHQSYQGVITTKSFIFDGLIVSYIDEYSL